MNINNKFTKMIISKYGKCGESWIRSLPSLVDKYAIKWGLHNLVEVDNLSNNYVLTGFRKKYEKVVLKISPSVEEAFLEASTLKFYNGRGTAHLYEEDAQNGVLLREYIDASNSMKDFFPTRDEELTHCAANVISLLHSSGKITDAEKKIFPSTNDWIKSLYNRNITSAIGVDRIDRAQGIMRELQNSFRGDCVLLHGDLHHDNLLQTASGWVAIDPKGFIGEPTFEVGAFIRNPSPSLLLETNPGKLLSRRAEIFSERLNLDKQRILECSYAQAVLAGCWSLEDGGSSEYWLSCADLLHSSDNYFFLPNYKNVMNTIIDEDTLIELWYTDSQIMSILNRQLTGERYNIITPTVFENNDLLSENIRVAITAAVAGDISVMPLHLHGNHWSGIVITSVLDQNENAVGVNIIFNNPQGQRLSDEPNFVQFQQLVMDISLELFNNNHYVNIIDLHYGQQSNGNDCGVYTVDNLIRIASAPGLRASGLEADVILEVSNLRSHLNASEILELRNMHTDILSELDNSALAGIISDSNEFHS